MSIAALRADPTRTPVIRRMFLADMRKRFRWLKGQINRLVVTEDAFGLAKPNVRTTKSLASSNKPVIIGNTRWAFETDANKIAAYQAWLLAQVQAGIYEVAAESITAPWLSAYLTSAYTVGIVRAYTDANQAGIVNAPDLGFVEGGRRQFLNQTFGGPVGQSKVKILGTRAFSHLKGVTQQMDQEMTRILATGMAAGDGPRKIARDLNKSVDTLTKKRALVIARTETTYAHSEGQLDAFEALEQDELTIMSEWKTAGDGSVCSMCAPMEGVVLSVKEARGLIPRHPNCRCAWIPAGVGENIGGSLFQHSGPEQGLSEPGTKPTGPATGQIWASSRANKAIQESVEAEKPKLDSVEAKKQSAWKGADVTVRKRRQPPAGSIWALQPDQER